jgi:hypothetical protein
VKRLLALLLALLVLVPAPLQLRAAYAAPWNRSGSGGSFAGAGSKLKEKLLRFKDGAGEVKDLAVEALKHNAGRAVVGALLVATGMGIYGHKGEHLRSTESEIVFSERSQMVRDAQAEGRELDPLTHYYATTNDMVMKVLEARNLSNSRSHDGSEGERLAKELQIKMELDNHTLTLPKLFSGEMNQSVQNARTHLQPIGNARNGLANTTHRLNGAWSHDHRDNYHDWDETVHYTENYTDANGKQQSRPATKIVHHHDYVDTDHWWTYTPSEGQAAAQGLESTRQQVPQINGVRLRTPSKTHADNEYAIESSRHLNERMSKDALRELSGIIARGAAYSHVIGFLEGQYNQVLLNDQAAVRSATGTAQTHYHYKTHSSFDSGPPEAQVFDRTLTNSNAFIEKADEIYRGLDVTQRNTQVLDAEIKKLLAVAIAKTQPGNADQIADNIVAKTHEIYQVNFHKGVDLRAYRGWVLALWIMAGLTLGGGAGYAVGPAIKGLKDASKRFIAGGQ